MNDGFNSVGDAAVVQGREVDVTLEIVVPLYNEEDVIAELLARLRAVFTPDRLREAGVSRVGFVFVDDGSTDGTSKLIAQAIQHGVPAELLTLSRNFGHQSALFAGLSVACADLVGIMDADLQDPPELFLDFVRKWREGCDVVYGIRTSRKEGFLKRASYGAFYRLLHWLTEGSIPRDAGDFCLMSGSVVKTILHMPERQHLFLRGMRAWVGFRQYGFPYVRSSRFAGAPKYSFKDLYMLATDGIISCSIRPLKVVEVLAICSFCATVVCGAAFATRLVVSRNMSETVFLLYIISLILCGIGFSLLVSLYIFGAYLGRLYLEVKGRPAYIIKERIGRGNDKHMQGR